MYVCLCACMLASVCVELWSLSGGGCQSERQQTCNRAARDYTIGVHKRRLPVSLTVPLCFCPTPFVMVFITGHKNPALV